MEKKKERKKRIVLINAVFALFFVFTAGYFFFSLNLLDALTGGVEFSDDVGVNLPGLSVPVDIGAGSSADSVEISGSTLSIFGAPAEQPFLLKTATHKLLQATPSETSADFSVSAMNINLSGYLSAWSVGTAGVIDYILGVEHDDDIYFIEKDGSAIEESPQYPTANQEVVFSATGDGSYKLAGTGGGVTFTEDVILDLEGLETTLYIAEGSSAGYLTVSATTLSVYGIPTSGFFHIKTDNHTVLKIEPTESTADFTLSSDNVNSLGHLSSWYADSSDILAFTVGVPQGNFYYTVNRNEVEIEGSPVLSTEVGEEEYEIVFSSLGVGTYSIYESHELGDAQVRGWAWSDNIGWICFSSKDDPESGEITYGVGIEAGGELSGHAWSSNLGWISFSQSDLDGCPEGPCIAKLDNGKLIGWAKALSNDEWISLSGDVYEEIAGTTVSRTEETQGDWNDNFQIQNLVGNSNGDLVLSGATSGYRISNSLSLDDIKNLQGSELEWITTLPTGTEIVIKVGVNESSTVPPSSWEEVLVIEEGADLTGKYLWIRQELSTENAEVTPQLHGLYVSVVGGSYPGEKIDEYGPTLVGNDFHGWAWGDTTLGWISFNCANNSECGTVNYKVWITGLGEIGTVVPTVRTDRATNINPEGTAILNGTLLSTGGHEETVVWFEWGTSESLGSSTPELERETKVGVSSFSEGISVILGETYYFRAVAENAEGLFYGNILRFTVTERTGQIIITFGDFWKGVEVSEDGRIEILSE